MYVHICTANSVFMQLQLYLFIVFPGHDGRHGGPSPARLHGYGDARGLLPTPYKHGKLVSNNSVT